MAREHAWQQILVVASEDQLSRARLLFGRCWSGRAWFVGGVHHPHGPIRVIYEWGAIIKAVTFKRGC